MIKSHGKIMIERVQERKQPVKADLGLELDGNRLRHQKGGPKKLFVTLSKGGGR